MTLTDKSARKRSTVEGKIKAKNNAEKRALARERAQKWAEQQKNKSKKTSIVSKTTTRESDTKYAVTRKANVASPIIVKVKARKAEIIGELDHIETKRVRLLEELKEIETTIKVLERTS